MRSKLLYRCCLYFLVITSIAITVTRLTSYNRTIAGGDEGEYLNNAWRTYTGDKPYKDFWLLFSPAEVYMPATALKVFGLNFNVLLFCSAIVALTMGLMVFLILKELKCNTLLSLASSILFLMNGHRFFYFLLCLLSFYLLLLFIRKNKFHLIVLSGFAAGLSFLFRVYHVVPYYLAALIFLFVMMKRKDSQIKMVSIFAFVLASLIPVLVCVIMLNDILPQMYFAVIIDSVSHGTSMNVPYWFTVKEDWSKIFLYLDLGKTSPSNYPIKGLPFMFAEFLFHLLLHVLPFAIAILILCDLIKNTLQSFSSVKLLLLLWGIFYLPYAMNLSEEAHLKHAFSPLLILFFLYCNDFFKHKYSLSRIILSGFIFSFFVTNSLQLYQQLKPHYFGTYTLKTNTIKLNLQDYMNYGNTLEVLKSISEHTSKGDYIFSLGWSVPPLYAITGRRNPTYYDSPIDFLIRPSKQKEENIIRDLKSHNCKWIIVENVNFFNRADLYNTNPELISFIKNNYLLSKSVGTCDIYLLKE